MARKTKIVTIDGSDRDAGKTFLLTEMPARQAERWAIRLFSGAARSGMQIPDSVAALGVAGLASTGNLMTLLTAVAASPVNELMNLLDELMDCVQAMPNPADPRVVRPLVDTDTEEVATRAFLKKEVFKLHVDFSPAAAP